MIRSFVLPIRVAPILSMVGVLLSVSSAPAQAVLPSNTVLARYGLVRAWWNQATTSALRDQVQYLVADEELVYVQSSSGIVTAFDAETGGRAWAVQLARQDDPTYPVASNTEVAVIAIGTHLYAIDKRIGNIVWDLRVPALPSTSPGMDDRMVYVGCGDGGVLAFDLAKLASLHRERKLPQWIYQATRWKFQASGPITSPPLPLMWKPPAAGMPPRPTVNFAAGRSLYSVLADKRELHFQFETDAVVSAPLSFSQGNLYMPSQDADLYCVALNNGHLQWRFVSGAPIRRKAVVIGSDVFVTPTAAGMFCLNANDGDRRWRQSRVDRLLAATPRLLYASDERENVVLMARATGTLLGVLPLRQFTVRTTNDRTDRLYLATESGLVICIREAHQTYPLFHAYPERRPILPEFAPEQPEGQPAAPAEKQE